MNYEAAKKMLDKCGQGHVLAWWNKLSKKGQNALLEQIEKIDPKSLAYCQKALKAGMTAQAASPRFSLPAARVRASATTAPRAATRSARSPARLSSTSTPARSSRAPSATGARFRFT